jgi:hypothetical protein
MPHHEREAFVAALLAGELSRADPEVEARLRAEPELRIMIERMREVEAAAAHAAGEEREVLSEARAGGDAGFGGRVTAAVQQVVAERQRARRLRWLAAAALAGATVAVGWLLLRMPSPHDPLLGGGEHLRPQGAVDGTYSPFSWDAPLPTGGRFELRIYGDALRTDLRYPKTPEKVTSPWTLDPDREAALPDEIWWEVEVFGDDLPRTLQAHAWRRH